MKVTLKATENKDKLIVVSYSSKHNHDCLEAFFATLPRTRRKKLSGDNVATTTTTKTLLEGGVKTSTIRSILCQ